MATPLRCAPDEPVTAHVVSSVVGRLFRLVPTANIVASLWFVLGAALEQFPGVQLHEAAMMSNHWHMVLTASDGNLAAFYEYFNSLAARQVNAIHGESGKMFEAGPSVTVLLDSDAVLEACSYVLANPCAADLVARASDWQGVTTVAMAYDEPKIVRRPLCGMYAGAVHKPPKRVRKGRRSSKRAKYVGRSRLKDSYSVTLSRPELLQAASDDEARRVILASLASKEEKHRQRRAREGTRVVGMRFARSCRPSMTGPKRNLFLQKRKFAGSKERVIAALTRYKVFCIEYGEALGRLRAGEPGVVFPHGTCRMKRLGIVRVAGPP